MAYCGNCGNEMEDKAQFCEGCGFDNVPPAKQLDNSEVVENQNLQNSDSMGDNSTQFSSGGGSPGNQPAEPFSQQSPANTQMPSASSRENSQNFPSPNQSQTINPSFMQNEGPSNPYTQEYDTTLFGENYVGSLSTSVNDFYFNPEKVAPYFFSQNKPSVVPFILITAISIAVASIPGILKDIYNIKYSDTSDFSFNLSFAYAIPVVLFLYSLFSWLIYAVILSLFTRNGFPMGSPGQRNNIGVCFRIIAYLMVLNAIVVIVINIPGIFIEPISMTTAGDMNGEVTTTVITLWPTWFSGLYSTLITEIGRVIAGIVVYRLMKNGFKMQGNQPIIAFFVTVWPIVFSIFTIFSGILLLAN